MVIVFSTILIALLAVILYNLPTLAEQQVLDIDNEPAEFQVEGPFLSEPVQPYIFYSDVRNLLPSAVNEPSVGTSPVKYVPGSEPKGPSTVILGWEDPVRQMIDSPGEMPTPINHFPGISYTSGGSGWPPDTNGDVGPNHYLQTVNTSLAIFIKTTGQKLAQFTFNQFFDGTGTPCDNQNFGDPVVVYDRLADRWLVTDFAVPGSPAGYYECMAISRTGDPVSGGWNLYGIKISDKSLNDYPKFGVWPNAYFMSANMFKDGNIWDGVEVWAFNRSQMLAGAPVQAVHFALSGESGYSSLLPSHMLSMPPTGSPNYFASVSPPDQLQLWEFQVDWATPLNATFTGPVILHTAEFAMAASVPQHGSPVYLDSLSFRPMMQLQYRNMGDMEVLWLNHTVASQGVAGVRWYEVRDPGGTPDISQQGTYQPDSLHRWMGSLAVDRDGNMAVGYSVSSSEMYPSIRYAGRLAGELPGVLTQGEASLIEGNGAQLILNRWGDYSAMSVDPVDDCTFWYTNEYYLSTGTDWQTRIGYFKFPSCGQPKGYIQGTVRNSVTQQPISNVQIIARGAGQTITVQTDTGGMYHLSLASATYQIVAGPHLPGYPDEVAVSGILVRVGQTETIDIHLVPKPYLVESGILLDDSGTHGNGNSFPEPGEQGILIWQTLQNIGAVPATGVSAEVVSLSAGVKVEENNAGYPDIPVGITATNITPFMISLAPTITCGEDLQFREILTTGQGVQYIDFHLNASVVLPRQEVLNNDTESGSLGWSTGGSPNQWGITSLKSNSPSHSWTDSPDGRYSDDSDTYLRTPALDLSGKRHIQISGWFSYELEAGYDYVYLEYSLNGGSDWNQLPLHSFNGHHNNWEYTTIDAPALDGQSDVALRFRLVSDQSVTFDGIYIDDIVLTYEPISCDYTPKNIPGRPKLLFPEDGGFDYNPVLFLWEDGNNGFTTKDYVMTIDGAISLTVTAPATIISTTLPLGNHTWSVTAINDEGPSLESELWTFEVLATISGIPGAPALISPPDGTELHNPIVVFRWEADRLGGTPNGYIFNLDGIDVYTSSNRVNWLAWSLDPGVHTWRVRAYNDDGISLFSEQWTVNLPYIMYYPFIRSDQK
jgi:hypothetical protein